MLKTGSTGIRYIFDSLDQSTPQKVGNPPQTHQSPTTHKCSQRLENPEKLENRETQRTQDDDELIFQKFPNELKHM